MLGVLKIAAAGTFAAWLGLPFALQGPPPNQSRGAEPPATDVRTQDRDERPAPPERGPGGRDWRGQRGDFRLTPEMREHVNAVISDLLPLSEEERSRLSGMSDEELRELLAQQGGQSGIIFGLARLRQAQPELYDLRVEDMRLSRKIRDSLQELKQAREASNATVLAAAEGELRAAVEEQIELRFRIREREIAALEARVIDMREELAKERESPRDELVSRRLEMLENDGGRDWWRRAPDPGSVESGTAPPGRSTPPQPGGGRID